MAALGTPLQQTLAFTCLTLITVLVVLVYRVSQRGGGFQYSAAAAMACAEMVKLAIAWSFLSREAAAKRGEYTAVAMNEADVASNASNHVYTSTWMYVRSFTSKSVVVRISVLSLMYAVNNQLTFVCLTMMPPAFFNMFKSGTAFLSAVMMLLLLKQRLPATQWLSLAMQCAGLVIAQYDPCTGTARLPLTAYVVVMTGVSISALCNVWNAHMIKSLGVPLHGVNLILYSCGSLLNLGFYQLTKTFPEAYGQASAPTHFFQGFSPSVLLVIACNSLLGLAISFVYKYADAIVKTLAASANTVIWMVVLGPVFFGSAIDVTMVIGCAIVTLSTYMYLITGDTASSSSVETAAGKRRDSDDAGATERKSRTSSASSERRTALVLLAATVVSAAMFNQRQLLVGDVHPDVLLTSVSATTPTPFGLRAPLEGRVALLLVGNALPNTEAGNHHVQELQNRLVSSLAPLEAVDVFVCLASEPTTTPLAPLSPLSVQYFRDEEISAKASLSGCPSAVQTDADLRQRFAQAYLLRQCLQTASASAERRRLAYQWVAAVDVGVRLTQAMPSLHTMDWASVNVPQARAGLLAQPIALVPAPLLTAFIRAAAGCTTQQQQQQQSLTLPLHELTLPWTRL